MMLPRPHAGHALKSFLPEARSPAGEIDDDVRRKILVSEFVGMTIAAITTLLRVALRFRRFWWDDGLALSALALLIVSVATASVYYNIHDGSAIPQGSRVALYYTFAVTFDMTIWISRLSLMANIIRLGSYQKRLYSATALFLAAMLILVAQVFWVCEPQDRHTHWKSDPVPQCILGRSVAITQITTDVFADIVLVAVPLLLLRYLQANEFKMQKLRLGVSFAVGGFTSIVSIVHTVYLLQNTQISIVVSNVELSISVIISNFAVLAAAANRLWNKYHPEKQTPEQSTIRFETPQKSTFRAGSMGVGGAFTIDIGSRGDGARSDDSSPREGDC